MITMGVWCKSINTPGLSPSKGLKKTPGTQNICKSLASTWLARYKMNINQRCLLQLKDFLQEEKLTRFMRKYSTKAR